MQIDTGEMKRYDDLTEEEKQDERWVEVPAALEADAEKAIKSGSKVNLRKPSALSRFAREKRKELTIKATERSHPVSRVKQKEEAARKRRAKNRRKQKCQ